MFRIPKVTIRDVTMRQETMKCGSYVLICASPGAVSNELEASWIMDANVLCLNSTWCQQRYAKLMVG